MSTNSDIISTGAKIKHLRTTVGLSQLQLENLIGAAPGSVSRMESGRVNPTKETLLAIAAALQLTPNIQGYLFGLAYTDPTEAEIKLVIDQLEPVFEDPHRLAYLLNTKSQILAMSEGFNKLCREVTIDSKALIGKNVLSIMFDPEIGAREFFDPEHFDEMGMHMLAVIHQERHFLLHEPWWQEFMDYLQSLPDVKRLLKLAESNRPNLQSENARKIYFKTPKGDVETIFNVITVPSDPRLFLIEYTTP